MPVLSYQEIVSYSQLVMFQENLEGFFLSSVLSNQPELYYRAMFRIVLLGQAYKINPGGVTGIDMTMPNPKIIEKDIRKLVAHTSLCLVTVIRAQDIDKTKEVVQNCICLLFDSGYRYDGSDLSGSQESSESTPSISSRVFFQTDENDAPDVKLDDDMDDFLKKLLGGQDEV